MGVYLNEWNNLLTILAGITIHSFLPDISIWRWSVSGIFLVHSL
jgi:hypothetical protein